MSKWKPIGGETPRFVIIDEVGTIDREALLRLGVAPGAHPRRLVRRTDLEEKFLAVASIPCALDFDGKPCPTCVLLGTFRKRIKAFQFLLSLSRPKKWSERVPNVALGGSHV